MYLAFTSLLIVFLPLFLTSAFAGDLIRWTDESGTVHFTDSLDNVTEKSRAQAKHEKFKEEKVPQRNHSEGNRVSSDEATRCLEALQDSTTNIPIEEKLSKLRCTNTQAFHKWMEDNSQDRLLRKKLHDNRKLLDKLLVEPMVNEQAHVQLETLVREQRYNEIAKILAAQAGSPASMLPWLRQQAEAGHVPLQFEFSKALASSEPPQALSWFAIARIGATLDAVLCADKTAGSAVSALTMAYGQYIRPSMTDSGYKTAVEQALQWHEQHPLRPSALWICSHGMGAFTGQAQLIPVSQWVNVQHTAKEKIRASLNQMGKP